MHTVDKKFETAQVQGPTAIKYTVLSNGPNASVAIDYDPDTIGSGLYIVSRACPLDTRIEGKCTWSRIQTSDGVLHNATSMAISSDGKQLLLGATVDVSAKVQSVSYGWGAYTIASVYNSYRLAAAVYNSTLMPN